MCRRQAVWPVYSSMASPDGFLSFFLLWDLLFLSLAIRSSRDTFTVAILPTHRETTAVFVCDTCPTLRVVLYASRWSYSPPSLLYSFSPFKTGMVSLKTAYIHVHMYIYTIWTHGHIINLTWYEIRVHNKFATYRKKGDKYYMQTIDKW